MLRGVATIAAMKRLYVLVLISLGTLVVPTVAEAAPGDLDPSFGGDGKVTTDFGGDVQGEILSAAIDSHVLRGRRQGDDGLRSGHLGRSELRRHRLSRPDRRGCREGDFALVRYLAD
jgi:hypothetical protein